MEYLDVVDENNRFTGEVKSRKLVHEKGLWHREVGILVINKDKILLQKRSANKKMAPNKWAITGGHIDQGETIIKAAIREVTEELGIPNLKPSDLKLIHLQKLEYSGENGLSNNRFIYYYVLKTDLDEKDFVIQKEELSEVKYMSFNDILNLKKTKANMQAYTNSFFEPYIKDIIFKTQEYLKEEN